MSSTFSYTCWPFLCLLWKNIHSGPLPIFYLGFLFVCLSLSFVSSLYILCLELLKKLNTDLLYNLVIPLLDICPREIKTYVPKKTHIRIYIETMQKTGNIPCAHQQNMNKHTLVYLHTGTIKKSAIRGMNYEYNGQSQKTLCEVKETRH